MSTFEEFNPTGSNILELLKTVHCSMDKRTLYELLGVKDWAYKEDLDDLYEALRRDLFSGLCRLDSSNIEKVFQWAKAKRGWR